LVGRTPAFSISWQASSREERDSIQKVAKKYWVVGGVDSTVIFEPTTEEEVEERRERMVSAIREEGKEMRKMRGERRRSHRSE
jgi:hypothetical protein